MTESGFLSNVKEKFRNEILAPISYLPESEKPDIEKVIQFIAENFVESVSLSEFKGHYIPPGFSSKAAEWQYENWKPNKEDVLIATFPKTGTTWMKEIVRQLLNKGNEESMKISKTITIDYCYVERSNEYVRTIYDKLPLKRRLYVTHLPPECLNMEVIEKSGCKMLYVMRNPKDTLVSFYHFIQSIPFPQTEVTKTIFPKDWNQFFEFSITGKQGQFCKKNEWYPHHILSWCQYRNNKNIKFVYYEDIKKDPTATIEEISQFLGCDRTKEEILEIANDTSIRSMKTQGVFEKLNIRKGIIGDWKNYFTVAQSEMMDKKFNEVLSGTDIKFSYE